MNLLFFMAKNRAFPDTDFDIGARGSSRLGSFFTRAGIPEFFDRGDEVFGVLL